MAKLILTFFTCFSVFVMQAQSGVPQRYDVVIDEILADPNPVVGLLNAEFIELKNTSGKSINLQGWKVKSLGSSSGPFNSYLLPADSFLIITSTTNSSLFAPFGKALGVASFPALNNAGTTLSLISKEGKTIHSLNYNIKWFQNDVKSNGGWSLEMIDTRNPCTGSDNWKASIAPKGGTPGSKNSVDADNPDKIAPALLRAAALDSIHVLLTFSEPVDSAKAANAANFTISDGIGSATSITVIPPSFTGINLTLSVPLLKSKVYTVTANNIEDCSGNIIQAINKTRVGLAGVIDTFDIIINEILFNPKPSGVDYVEIYNRSNKILDLKDVYIANRSSATNTLGSIRRLTTDNISLFPADFFVISADGSIVRKNYVARNPENFIDVAMPSLPDDEGVFVLLNGQGKIIDELHYNSKWHFALIDNEEGVALERIDYNKPTQNKDNWTSAASSAGFGTPSYENSQLRNDLMVPGAVTVTPKTFSPDNDGFDDYTFVNVTMSDPGYVANITIFDAFGRPVKDLVKNATLGSTAAFKWDGLDDKFHKVPVGVYVVYTEVYNINGKKKSFKNPVVVAMRF